MSEELNPAPDGYLIAAVRDGTADVINSTGEPGQLFYRRMPYEHRVDFLKQKLGEEVIEYIRDPSLKELGDVLAVVDALALESGTTLFDLFQACIQNHPRGGFRLGIGMYGFHPEFDGEEQR